MPISESTLSSGKYRVSLLISVHLKKLRIPRPFMNKLMRKPKLIYYNDARHYLMYRYGPPLSKHVLQ